MKKLIATIITTATLAACSTTPCTNAEADKLLLKKEYVEAYECLLPLAMDNDIVAEVTLGTMTSQGLGTEKDTAKAWAWFKLAAENGSEYGAKSASMMYVLMTDEEKSAAEAAHKKLLKEF